MLKEITQVMVETGDRVHAAGCRRRKRGLVSLARAQPTVRAQIATRAPAARALSQPAIQAQPAIRAQPAARQACIGHLVVAES